jgi:hypothetical protein
MPVHRALCIAAGVAILIASPAATYPQSSASPAFELGGTFNGFLVVTEDPILYPMFGVRATTRASTLWAVQFDVDVPMAVTSAGRYGVRLRYTPAAASSPWYGFGGIVGTFILPENRRLSERAGSIRWPSGVRVGVGRRVLSHGRWGMLVEGEGACSVYGGITLSVGVEVAFAARRASRR